MGGSSDIRILPKVFTGRHPFGELATPVITSKVMDGSRPARPQEAQELGLTDLVWDMTVWCWHQDPVQRPTIREVVGLAREWPVLSLSSWNQYHDMLPAATGWQLLGGLKSQISQSRSSPTTFYHFVNPKMYFPLVAPTSSLPSSQLMIYSGNKSWWSITISQGQRQPEQVGGN